MYSLQWESQSPLGVLGIAIGSTALSQVQNARFPVVNLELIMFFLGVLRVPGFTVDQLG